PGIGEERLTQNASCLTLEIKPNPTRSMIRVRCPVSVKEIKIYDITGKIIKTIDVIKKVESGQYEIKWDLRDDNRKRISTGIYFIEIKTEDKESEIRKITVVK
ncbi:MAG: T9SS type A sorting domain-containing protein, partial [candidate division WOR-3 bacterium]|nr:T9SS type A sorting domain-containing protein [candidate division WOR-3 bacterium]